VTGPLYLAWRYLAYHRVKTAILVTSIALIVYLPIGLQVLVNESATQLRARAEGTPLLLGAKGSPLELVLSSLYFESRAPAVMAYREVTRVAEAELAEPIPLHVRFRSHGHPIVGTTLEYFGFRGLELARGRLMAVLGECVLGAEAARDLGAGPGDHVVSSPESVFDLAGVYPLRMRVVGVLAPSHTPDDRAIFADVKTTWVIEGLGHGHADLSRPEAAASILSQQGDTLVANASVVAYNEITEANLPGFHFHGDLAGYPITGLLAVPRDDKSGVLLQGRYQAPDESTQIVRPRAVLDDLLDTVFTVRRYVVAALLLVAVSTLATAALVFALSLRLRRREIATVARIGGSRASVALLLGSEVVLVLIASAAVAACLTLATRLYGAGAIRSVLLS